MGEVTIKRLAPEEFDRLTSVHDGVRPNPEISIALVAENGEGIVGRMFLIAPAHIEGTWVKEGYRKGKTGLRLIRQMETEAKQAGISKVFSYAEDEKIEKYLEHFGYQRCMVSVWTKEI